VTRGYCCCCRAGDLKRYCSWGCLGIQYQEFTMHSIGYFTQRNAVQMGLISERQTCQAIVVIKVVHM
jgi:hypothetical protein